MSSTVKRTIAALEGHVDVRPNTWFAALAKAAVPEADASIEDKRAAQKKRSERYGIEALEGKGESLSWPAGYPQSLSAYGDPVNLKYPFETVERARNARARFKQNADVYTKTKSKQVVHNRIVERLLVLGVKPSYNPDDPLDKLLSSDVKERLTG
jgi:hypothetical protein